MQIILFIVGIFLGASAVYLYTRPLRLKHFEAKKFEQGYYALREKLAGYETTQLMQEKQSVQQKEVIKNLEVQFENLANRIFESKKEAFKIESKQNIEMILSPLRENLMHFQKRIQESFTTQASLKGQVEQMLLLNKKLSSQTENLTDALKGNVKTHGDWGEIILEKILEASGLRKGQEYTLQGEGLGLKNSETGAPLKPDVVVNLPDSKHLIIDSKLSLVHYERYQSAKTEIEQAKHLHDFIQSVRAHIKNLESKKYQDSDKLGTPDFVMLFMPIEGAYILATLNDPELHSFAWDKRIVLVSASTLTATLKTVASIWQMDHQNKNAYEIAQEGGKLYDKVAGFVEDMDKLGLQIQTTQRTYRDAMTKFSEGKGNILSKTQKLKELGSKTTKSISKTDLIEE
ncbi:MAG: DNA recombination protein RmuC [Alphaproteobacteria bacterium]|nr:DNA recombination protein RmuC [Alphaproteobacteria bacterium]